MKQIGNILIITGIIGLIYFQLFFDTSVPTNIDRSNYILKEFPERVNNLGLMQDKQNYTFISMGLLLIGVILFVADKKTIVTDKNNNNENSENDIKPEPDEISKNDIAKKLDEYNYYCSNCGDLNELEYIELQNKIFICSNCKTKNNI